MIGKPEWFTYRILGWGIRPKTWQGWAYILVLVAAVVGIMALPIVETWKIAAATVVIVVFVIDTIHIMFKLDSVHDERERLQQLIIERNSSFAAIAALIAVMLFQVYQNRAVLDSTAMPFDISIIIVLAAMLAAKIISTIYVRMKM